MQKSELHQSVTFPKKAPPVEVKEDVGKKRKLVEPQEADGPPTKMQKSELHQNVYQSGVIERGHVYFFYRPRVQHEEAHSLKDVKNFHMLLVPCPPEFASANQATEESTGIKDKPDPELAEQAEMKVVEPGTDAVPAHAEVNQPKEKYRLITIGKKHLPDPEKIGARGGARKEVFWATMTALGDDLTQLRSGLGPKTYGTKTRELLDYLQAQLLMIAARSGAEGLKESLGEDRGEALHKNEAEEGKETVDQIFAELGSMTEKFPAKSLEGEWI
ncbi:hypothetical protein AN958_01502 [Leucoagaricus sp. SymC.cos]|nr:hypothetical protein AN958_01502 [Leucoagaricus sp. SymC.cos]